MDNIKGMLEIEGTSGDFRAARIGKDADARLLAHSRDRRRSHRTHALVVRFFPDQRERHEIQAAAGLAFGREQCDEPGSAGIDRPGRSSETGEPVARQTRRLLEGAGLLNPQGSGSVQWQTSGAMDALRAAAARWLGL